MHILELHTHYNISVTEYLCVLPSYIIAFHKKCWFEWENAHCARVDRNRRRGEVVIQDEGLRPKCCLCNTVNTQFVDGNNSAPLHNPSPYVASEDATDNNNNNGGTGNRFTNWFRGFGEEVNDFIQNEVRNNLPGGRDRGNNNNGRQQNQNNNPFVPPFFPGTQQQQQQSRDRGASSYTNNNTANQIRPGTKVMTQNLVNAPHLNQQRGVILRYQPQSSRYLVQLQSVNISGHLSDVQPLAIKPQNLLQVIKVKISKLQSQTQLNGKEGTILSYSVERNRYMVRVQYFLAEAREVSLQPKNIRIPIGTCVRLEGLETASQWNGKYGTIVRWVEDATSGSSSTSSFSFSSSGRYEVCLSRQYGVLAKPDNVRL